jgi:hypothetical protein
MSKFGRAYIIFFWVWITCVFCLCWAAEPNNDQFSEAQKSVGPVESMEDAINALIDPFLSKMPKPEQKIIPVEPVKIAPPVEIPPKPLEPVYNPRPFEPAELPPALPQPPLSPETTPEFILTGIIYNTIKPQAIINGTVVYVGDIVLDGKVVSIEKGVVKILYKTNILNVKIE